MPEVITATRRSQRRAALAGQLPAVESKDKNSGDKLPSWPGGGINLGEETQPNKRERERRMGHPNQDLTRLRWTYGWWRGEGGSESV